MSRHELLLYGYFRETQKSLSIDIPSDVSSIIALFYPKYIDFERCKIKLTDEEKQMITNWLIETLDLSFKSTILSSKFLYGRNTDGAEANAFHLKCDDNPNTFAIIKVKGYDHIIGYFISKPFNQNDEPDTGLIGNYITDNKIFICVIRSCFKDKKPQIFRVKKDIRDTYFNASDWLPSFKDYSLHISTDNYCYSKSSLVIGDSHFEPFVVGNLLAAGDEYCSDEKFYNFEIEDMNIFSIHMCDT